MSSIPPEEHERSLVMLDVVADFLERERTKLNLNVAVRGVKVGREDSIKCYVGCESIEVIVSSDTGSFVEHSGAIPLKVMQRNKKTQGRKASIALKPELGVKAGGAVDASVSLGDVTFERSRDLEQESEYENEERVLSPVNSRRVVRWAYDPPGGNNVIRDYIDGNLELHAVCQWEKTPKSGKVEVRALQCRVYGPIDKRPVSRLQQLMLRFQMGDWIDEAQARRGISVTFTETDE